MFSLEQEHWAGASELLNQGGTNYIKIEVSLSAGSIEDSGALAPGSYRQRCELVLIRALADSPCCQFSARMSDITR